MRAICNWLELLALLQLLANSQGGHVQQAKRHIRAEFRAAFGDAIGPAPSHLSRQHHPQQHHYHGSGSHWHHGQRVHRLRMPQQRWSGRRRAVNHHQPFSRWTQWTECGGECVSRRERYCKAKRRCGHTKHVEERKCQRCHLSVAPRQEPLSSHAHMPAIIINAAAAASGGSGVQTTQAPELRHPPPSVEVVHPSYYDEDGEHGDFFVLKRRRHIRKQLDRRKKKHRPVTVSHYNGDYNDDPDAEDDFEDYGERQAALRPRSLAASAGMDSGSLEGDIFQYEDFDFDQDSSLYVDSEEYADYRNTSWLSPAKERNSPDGLSPRHRRLYSKWSRWTKCSPKCTTRRYKKCRVSDQCGREVLREIAYCYTENSFCQQWLQAQVQKSPAYEGRLESGPGSGSGSGSSTALRRMHTEPMSSNNAIVSDVIMHGKGYRGPEYTPPKLRCGLAPARGNGRRSMYNMLKIIGGKAARKGEWPWQVAIFNRFKEAFCGGTLIAPSWVLTAAHCVRKVLYVRVGEHNLDYEDGTEMQLRVLKSYKHPSFDKRTVDSDVALLRLPKPVNATTWIGYSCLPRPYQPLPKNMDCTVIGWGKRRNRDVAGTSVLHQAEVPIIPMDNCRSVYHDYTITKNMFCAGHRRGRIDTCAGDSGGPLLCRDTTKPNHPWTIFGITSFGDGCAKRNKFGIYAKVPNYVDWVWSVVNCNGNCKLHQRP